jgi:hypothetical protein
MYQIYRGPSSPTAEISNEVVRVIDQTTERVVFEADADSYLTGRRASKLSEIEDAALIEELQRIGKIP